MPRSDEATRQRDLRCQRFQQVINDTLKAKSMTHRSLAAMLGITQGTLSAYTAGKVDPLNARLVIQHQLAQLLGISLAQLIELYEAREA